MLSTPPWLPPPLRASDCVSVCLFLLFWGGRATHCMHRTLPLGFPLALAALARPPGALLPTALRCFRCRRPDDGTGVVFRRLPLIPEAPAKPSLASHTGLGRNSPGNDPHIPLSPHILCLCPFPPHRHFYLPVFLHSIPAPP